MPYFLFGSIYMRSTSEQYFLCTGCTRFAFCDNTVFFGGPIVVVVVVVVVGDGDGGSGKWSCDRCYRHRSWLVMFWSTVVVVC